MATYDVVVVGTGGVGSAVACHVASRGARVLGIDRFPGGHDRGSSHGVTRVIRQAYFEHPDYVPLLREAYRLWHALEQQSGTRLYHDVGLLQIGPPDGPVISGVLASARQHQLDVSEFAARQIEERWPEIRVPAGCVGAFERQAGYLLVESCVLTHLAQAQAQGAELVHDETVRSWQVRDGECLVTTDRHTYRARRLVITAGPWSRELLTDLRIPLRVLRKHLHWIPTGRAGFEARHGFPTYLFELPKGVFYGFPQIDAAGVKVGEHSGGTEIADPLVDERTEEIGDRQRVAEFVTECLPRLGFQRKRHAVCYYTMSPDEHFLVDRHPRWPEVLFAAGLSGHGFKFASVLGRVLADWALDDTTPLPVTWLGTRRLAGR